MRRSVPPAAVLDREAPLLQFHQASKTYHTGDNIMINGLGSDGAASSNPWLRLIDGDHAWRADGLPFFFTGGWREWQGDVGTIKQPNVGLHRLYSILTTEPNGVVQPIHDKAMPVMLMTAEDVDVWLNGTLEEALKLQKPQPDDTLVITPYDEKKAA